MSSLGSPNRRSYLPLKQVDETGIKNMNQNTNMQEVTSAKPSLNEKTSNDDLLSKKGQQCGLWKTTLNMINAMEGVGFLALPYTVHRGGITAVIGFFVLPLLTGYTASILIQCLYEVNEDGDKIRVRSSYQEIGLHCWAPLSRLVCTIVGMVLFTATVSFVVLFSSMMHQVFPGVPLTESQWACVAIGIVFPTVFIKRFSNIAWLSVLSLIALLVSVCLSLTYEFQEVKKWDAQSLLFWDTEGVFIAVNIILFSYGVHGIIIPMEGEMADKSKFPIALLSCYCTGGLMKVVFAVAGFLTYTSATNEVILNNLPAGITIKIIGTLFSASVLISYPILLLVVVRILEESWLHDKMSETLHPNLCFALVRIGLVLLSLGFAVGMPHFALVTSFAGSLTYIIILIFPALFHLVIKYNTLTRFDVCIDCFFVALGISGMGLGLVVAVKELVMAT